MGDIGAGEPVGEFAVFTGEPRMASTFALRKTVVLEYSADAYKALVKKKPELSQSITGHIIERLRSNNFERRKRRAPENIAIIALEDDLPLDDVLDQVKESLQTPKFDVNTYTKQTFQEQGEGEFFDALEEEDDLSFLVCHPNQIAWTKLCVLYADLIVLVSNHASSPKLRTIEKSLNLYEQNISNKDIYLLLLNNGNKEKGKTAQWLEHRTINLHIHLNPQVDKDVRRLSRILTRKVVGLVLGGGGSKGFSHIGVFKAMNEAGIEIDFLGGTSSGALYGVGMTYLDFDEEKIIKQAAEGVSRSLTRDYALPVVSLITGKKMKNYLKDMYEGYDMEDVKTTCYTVSANYTKSKMEVLNKGKLWRNVLASLSIPGVFPPVVIDRNLHIDGGLVDNLPVEPMYNYPVDIIYAVALTPLQEQDIDYAETPSSWKIALDKVSGKKRFRVPGLGSIIANSMTLNSDTKQAQYKDQVSHYIELKLKGYSMLGDSKWEELIDKGYEQTKAYLDSIDLDKI